MKNTSGLVFYAILFMSSISLGGTKSEMIKVRNDFFIDKFEVSLDEYKKCVAALACEKPVPYKDYYDDTKKDLPVVYVRADQAESYCKWKNKRLPKYNEWLSAVLLYNQSNLNTTKNNEIIFDETINMGPQATDGLWPTKLTKLDKLDDKPLNLIGNAWEWTCSKSSSDQSFSNSCWSAFSSEKFDDISLIYAGGGYNFTRGDLSLSHLNGEMSPYVADESFGFRCARDIN